VEANELAFFGKIAAGVTHEIRNVLATINESNGLMADLLEVLKGTPFVHMDKFQRSIGRIEEQVRRGVEIAQSFNRFSHSVDHAFVHVDLNEIVGRTVALAAHFCRLRNVELKATVCDQPIMLFTNAFRVQMALTRAMEALLACRSGEGTISLATKGDHDPPSLDVRFVSEAGEGVSTEALAQSGEWREFEELASIVDIRYQWRAPGGGLAMFFCRAPARGQPAESK